MALVAAQNVGITGASATYGAVTSSDTFKFTNSSRVLHVKNGSGSSITVTVVVPGTKYGQANPDVVVTVGAGADKFLSGFTAEMADTTTGLITVTYSSTTTVTAALLAV